LLFVGEEEVAKEVYPLKDTLTGEEKKLSFERIVSTATDRRTGHSEDDEFDVSDMIA